MKPIFSALTRLSLRFRLITILLAIAISVAGVVAVTQLKQELIPSIEFPQTIILAQAGGMTGEQVLGIVTERLESSLDAIPQIVNLESTTTSSFGAVITARNNFGVNSERLRAEIQTALDGVWLPLRRITPPEGEDASTFSARLLNDLSADVLIFLEERDANFVFQLSPAVWESLSPETTRTLVAYLADQTSADAAETNALRRLVEQEVAPLLENIPLVARVEVSGGQVLPDEAGASQDAAPTDGENEAPRSLLLQLTPEVWAIVRAKLTDLSLGELDDAAVATLSALDVTLSEGIPALPESWSSISPFFKNAADIREMRTLTRGLGATINTFQTTGQIVGALGQTDDLTPDTIAQMLAIDPTMIQYFESDHLAAMSEEVFASLPADFIANLDGFTRDELAAKALARAITGENTAPEPVDLPNAWRIQPPSLITFSFDDLPLASFSIAGTGVGEIAATTAPEAEATTTETTETPATTDDTAPEQTVTIPEGPALPFFFSLLGGGLGFELDTADDMLNIQLPEQFAAQLGTSSLRAADLLSFLLLLDNPEASGQAGIPAVSIPGGAAGLIGQLSPEVISFLAEYDPTFIAGLSAGVYDAFSDAVLALPIIAPPLDQVWNTLSNQPQFANQPLTNARQLLALGDGSAASILNTLDTAIPASFAGYEVRLFNSLTPGVLRFLALNDPNFYAELSADVVIKFSVATLESLPEAVVATLPEETAATVSAIIAGTQPTAADAQSALYQQDVAPADPDAPALNDDWQFIGDFIGVELDTADDFFRFFPNVPTFLNNFFDTSQGAAFAPNLFGNLTPDMLDYMVERQPDLLGELRLEALQLLSDEVVAALPADVQERIASGATPFVPTTTVTRLNGNSSLNVTVYKTGDANNIEAFHTVEDILEELDAERDDITVTVGFEQASFVEESISGVAREGGLGAVFAIVVILVFLSNGAWSRGPRAIVGVVLVGLFLGILLLLTVSQVNTTGADLGTAFNQLDIVVRVMLSAGVVVGLAVALYPGKLPYPAWRSTLVTAISIPLSVLMAMVFMRWIPPAVNGLLVPIAEGNDILTFLLRLFPQSITLNIMTLSGLTVAIGRVVDDSIVVLENIFRNVQEGGDKKQAIIKGTRDVSVAIFAATVITVVVFLPLGSTGGIIGEFFLPFGLAVTYSLLASFIVAITVVPVAAFLLLDPKEIGHAEDGVPERIYVPVLRWALANRTNAALVLLFAAASLVFSGILFGTRPQAFLPSFGEPQITVDAAMPSGTKIVDTNGFVRTFETRVRESFSEDEIGVIGTTIGGGSGLASLILGSSSVDEAIAQITLGIGSPDNLTRLTGEVRELAIEVFGEENVSVSAASLSEQGFGGFALVLTGPQADLEAINNDVIVALNAVDGLANASSSLADAGAAGAGASTTFIRIDEQSALRFTGELETQNALGVTNTAIAAVKALPNLPASISVTEGFESSQQTDGFRGLIGAMGIAIVLVILILIVTFGSVVHWLDIILSILVAPVGAAILLTVTDRVLGISALIGLLMLIGIVVTNAVVLIDRVQQNQRERHMNTHDALIEAGGRRLRPILMTALATVFALVPLAIGLSEGAIIASELGTVVIGGLVSSTLLTLIVVPVAYSILDPLHKLLTGANRRPQGGAQSGD